MSDRLSHIASILVAFLSVALLGLRSSESVRLVQSVPVETELAQPNLLTTQRAWISLFHGAKSSIDIAEFYVSSKPGGPLDPVLRELERAAHQGVKIRVLLSFKMIKEDPVTLARLRAMPGALVRELDLSSNHGILHAKYFIVDGRDVFIGSQNFDWRALTEIHETGVIVDDSEVASELSRIFSRDWYASKNEAMPNTPLKTVATGKKIELVSSPENLNPPGIRAALPELLKLIQAATHSLKLTVMSYSITDHYGPNPGSKWTEIDDALRSAAKRGVRVQMLISDWGIDSPAIDELKSLQREPGIEIRIVSIPESRAGHIPFARVTHSKFMVVDDQILWVGSSNWERGYFYGSRNIDLILRKPLLARQAIGIFSRLWDSRFSGKLDPNRKYKPRKKN